MTSLSCVSQMQQDRAKPHETTKVFRGLQVLRAVGAILVLCTHAGFYVSERLIPGYAYWREGGTGVDLFFVLSGFVMIHSTRSLFARAGGWAIFAERRIVRIVPLYWVATTLKLVLTLAGTAAVLHTSAGTWQILCSYFFLPVRNLDHEFRPLLGVGWTLNFEMFFYLLFTLCIAIRANVYWFLGSVFTLLAIGSAFHGPHGPGATFYLDPIVLDFLYGMLIARFYRQRNLPMQGLLLAALLLASFVFLLVPFPVALASLHGVAAALIVWVVLECEPFLSWVPRWALFLGDASYAIYLFHPMIAPLAPAILRHTNYRLAGLSILLSIVLGIGAGALVHVWIELPITRFLKTRVRVRGKEIVHLPETVSTVR